MAVIFDREHKCDYFFLNQSFNFFKSSHIVTAANVTRVLYHSDEVAIFKIAKN